MEHLAVVALDEKTVKSIARLLKIWTERGIFEAKIQGDLNRIWATKQLEIKDEDDTKETNKTTGGTPPPQKKAKKGQYN